MAPLATPCALSADWKLRIQELLVACARAVEEDKQNTSSINRMVAELGKLVSVSGDPLQRLGAYMLEGLLARIDDSGYSVCKALDCYFEAAAAANQTTTEHFSYRHSLCWLFPYLKVGNTSAHGAIAEFMRGEDRIHIIDLCICDIDGPQWGNLLQAFANSPRGAPTVRITAIDASASAYQRCSNNLELAGIRLSHIAGINKVPFEFHAVAVSACQLEEGHLGVIPGEAVAVNLNLGLHNIPDDGDRGDMSSESQRDRILTLVKSLSPKVVTLVQQELNANSLTTFTQRFTETLDYYKAVFESADVVLFRDDDTMIKMEQHWLGREVVNLIACKGPERVGRPEVLDQWKARLIKAGFTPAPLNSLVNDTCGRVLRSYSPHYWLEERDGVLCLGWKNRVLLVTSAWH